MTLQDRHKQELWQDSVLIKFMDIGSIAERQVADVTHAFVHRDAALAADVIKRARSFNIETFLSKFPLGNSPRSEDVRFFATALRIGRKLERIEKASGHIANIALQPSAKPHLKPVLDLELMSRWIQDNLAQSLRAFADRDAALAERVVRDSSYIDDVSDQILRRLFTYMASDPPTLRLASKPMAVAQALQHAGDHVVDIAELTVLMLRSQVPR
jgi:phosphate transport system protein